MRETECTGLTSAFSLTPTEMIEPRYKCDGSKKQREWEKRQGRWKSMAWVDQRKPHSKYTCVSVFISACPVHVSLCVTGCVWVFLYVYLCWFVSGYLCLCMSLCVCICVCICVSLCFCVCLHISECVFLCVCVPVHTRVFVCVSVYVWDGVNRHKNEEMNWSTLQNSREAQALARCCDGLNSVPLKKMCWSPNPQDFKMWPYLEMSQFKMRSLVRAIIQCDYLLIKSGGPRHRDKHA